MRNKLRTNWTGLAAKHLPDMQYFSRGIMQTAVKEGMEQIGGQSGGIQLGLDSGADEAKVERFIELTLSVFKKSDELSRAATNK